MKTTNQDIDTLQMLGNKIIEELKSDVKKMNEGLNGEINERNRKLKLIEDILKN